MPQDKTLTPEGAVTEVTSQVPIPWGENRFSAFPWPADEGVQNSFSTEGLSLCPFD